MGGTPFGRSKLGGALAGLLYRYLFEIGELPADMPTAGAPRESEILGDSPGTRCQGDSPGARWPRGATLSDP